MEARTEITTLVDALRYGSSVKNIFPSCNHPAFYCEPNNVSENRHLPINPGEAHDEIYHGSCTGHPIPDRLQHGAERVIYLQARVPGWAQNDCCPHGAS